MTRTTSLVLHLGKHCMICSKCFTYLSKVDKVSTPCEIGADQIRRILASDCHSPGQPSKFPDLKETQL
jgi:hypothetical protein